MIINSYLAELLKVGPSQGVITMCIKCRETTGFAKLPASDRKYCDATPKSRIL
jgi:hypothetical protein